MNGFLFSSRQLFAIDYSAAVLVKKLSAGDMNASFAAQYGISFVSLMSCKDKLLYWNNCDLGNYGENCIRFYSRLCISL